MCLEITPLILLIMTTIVHVQIFVKLIDIPSIMVSSKVE
jgi:hypothetical protein